MYYSIFAVLLVIVIVVGVFMYLRKKKNTSKSSEAHTGYVKLQPNDSVEDILGSNDGVVAVLASWCGHCKKLKESKELEKLSSKTMVIEVDEKHKSAKGLMKYVGSKGYPTLIVQKKNNKSLYKGDRTAVNIIKAL